MAFNFGTVGTPNYEEDEITKEVLMTARKREVWARRIASVAGKGVTAFATGVIAAGVGATIANDILKGHDENNPAGIVKTTAAVGASLLGSVGLTAAWCGGAWLIENEIDEWSDRDFELEEVETVEEKNEFDPDKRVEFDFLK